MWAAACRTVFEDEVGLTRIVWEHSHPAKSPRELRPCLPYSTGIFRVTSRVLFSSIVICVEVVRPPGMVEMSW